MELDQALRDIIGRLHSPPLLFGLGSIIVLAIVATFAIDALSALRIPAIVLFLLALAAWLAGEKIKAKQKDENISNPTVKSKMDQASFEKQRTFEALLARQSDVIKAQTMFLTDFSNHIWEYHKISQRVSYCRLSGDKEAYEKAVREYQDSLWEILHKIRSAIGAARWFTSDTAHQALTSWYEDWFVRLASNLQELIEGKREENYWSEHHIRVHYEATKRNYGLLRVLAEDFGLRQVVEHPGRTERPAKK